jgi:PPOX class probable F420-dependent enzyme
MSDEQIAAFLAPARLGLLATLRADGAPVVVPVWFDWDGAVVRMFSYAGSGKIARLERDPRASLLVANSVGEPEAWVAFDGAIRIAGEGAFKLAARLAQRYWEMSDEDHQRDLERWRAGEAVLRVLELEPSAIRSSRG